jgi:hypothetical protein
MITNDILYGGTLNIGDFIFFSRSGQFDFGWYVGNGKTGTIQYIKPQTVLYSKRTYDAGLIVYNETGVGSRKLFSRPFNFENIGKDFIKKEHFIKVVKIENPDNIFVKGHAKDTYDKAKKILTDLNFIKS